MDVISSGKRKCAKIMESLLSASSAEDRCERNGLCYDNLNDKTSNLPDDPVFLSSCDVTSHCWKNKKTYEFDKY